MPLTPQDIVRKEFREALRGYNQSDVDLFLDEVVEEYTRLYDENQQMKMRNAALQQEIERLRSGGAATGLSAGARPDAERVENEVRARVRRFLEEQLRLLDASTPPSTAERVARDVPQASSKRPPSQGDARDFWTDTDR